MEPWILGKMLSPFLLLILAVTILIPVRHFLRKRMKDGWLKRLLLVRISGYPSEGEGEGRTGQGVEVSQVREGKISRWFYS